MKRLIQIASIGFLVAAASARPIEFRLDPVDNSGAGFEPGTLTYDFRVRHSANDFATAFSLLATLTNATFRDNSGPFAGPYAPDPQNFPFDPRLPFDCFITASDLYPNTNVYNPGEFAVPPGNVWGMSADGTRFGNISGGQDATVGFEYGLIPPSAGGDMELDTFARFTFIPQSPDWTLNVRGLELTTEGQVLWPIDVTAPEPGSAAMLFLLVVWRWRR